MVEGLDFVYIYPENDPEMVHIKLIDGSYAGVVYKYGKVNLQEKDGLLHLQFDFDVVESPHIKPKKLKKDTDFKSYIGNFLLEMISENIEQEIIDETGTDDLKEFDLQ
jgi:hypothetical protein